MNEQIKQFAEQTGYIWHASGDPQVYEFTPEKLEKFAELIVRECVTICQDIDGEDNIDARSGRQDCAVEIREHFGVSE